MFFQRLIARVLLIVLSGLLFACDGGSSSNSSDDNDENQSVQSSQTITTDENGDRIVTSNDTVVRVDSEGDATVLEDPSGNVTVTENSDGGNTINLSDNERIVTTPDGNISQTISGDNTIQESNIFVESEDE